MRQGIGLRAGLTEMMTRYGTSDADAERDITFREMLEELRAQTRQNADILAVMQRQWRVIAEDQYNLVRASSPPDTDRIRSH